jgi:hypothetical protein
MKKNFLHISILYILLIGLFYAKISETKKEEIDRNILKLTLFKKESSAKCLDGSPYGIYHADGYGSGKNKVIINFRQGGWCSGRDKQSFYNDCINRSKSSRGSSKNWDQYINSRGNFLGGEPDENINFYNWNRFDFPYCDGTGHQGLIKNPVKINNEILYFRGHLNTIKGFDFIFHKVKIEDIEEIVMTGCSAGGLATFYWIQYLADFIYKINNKVKIYGIPDSGFFVDYVNLKTKDNDYKLKLKILSDVVNKEVLPVNRECVRANLHAIHNCLLAENLIKYIKVPFLIIQPGYDSWQLLNILDQDCTKNGNIDKCNEKDLKIANEYKNYQNLLIERELNNKQNLSSWSPSCVIHCFKGKLSLQSWEVPRDSGNNINLVVKKFLENQGKIQIKLLDKVNWPENNKCVRKDLRFLIN